MLVKRTLEQRNTIGGRAAASPNSGRQAKTGPLCSLRVYNIINFQIKTYQHQAWWHLPIIIALRMGRQEVREFKVIFSNIMTLRPEGLNKTLSQKQKPL